MRIHIGGSAVGLQTSWRDQLAWSRQITPLFSCGSAVGLQTSWRGHARSRPFSVVATNTEQPPARWPRNDVASLAGRKPGPSNLQGQRLTGCLAASLCVHAQFKPIY
eukprot:365659-Chlamydomonas_euryale.AAC.3